MIIIRLFFAFLIFIPFLRFRLLPKTTMLKFFLIGVLQQGAAYVFYIEALKRLYSYEVAFFLIFLPFYVALFFSLYQNKLNLKLLALGAITIIGSAIIYPPSTFRSDALIGFILMQLCNVCFALGQVQYKRLQSNLTHIEERHFFPYMYLGALIITTIVFGLKESGLDISYISYQNYIYLFALGAISSGLGFFLWNKGVAKVKKSRVVLMNNIKIPVGVFCSIALFGEPASILQLIIGSSFFIVALLFERIFLNPPMPESVSA